MIKESHVEKIIKREFPDCLQSIEKISWDFQNEISIVELEHQYYSYDQIAEKIYEGKNSPKKPDMIIFKNDTLVFVEFKNGKIHSKDKDQIKVKAIEGCFLVLHELISKYGEQDVDFTEIINLKKSYVLVYNEDKNPSRSLRDTLYSREARFGLSAYEKTFFSRVRTLSPGIFCKLLNRETIA